MKAKVHILFALIVLFLTSGCMPGKVTRGDANLITRTIDISDYRIIQTGGGSMTINYVQSEAAPFFEITTDQNIFDMYEFVVEKEKTLLIRPKKEFRRNHSFRPTEFTVTTNSRNLEKVEAAGNITFNANSSLNAEKISFDLAGSGTINLPEQVTADQLRVQMAGNATLNAADISCREIKGEIAGSGTMNMGGITKKATFEIAGSGNVKAFNLRMDELKCNIAGSGDIEAYVNEKINVYVAGSGKVRYKGNPGEINRHIAGSGSVNKVD